MAEEPLHDVIEKYLMGELSPTASERLEAAMATDPALYEQVEIQRLALMGMQRLAAADLREKFDQWDEDLDAPTPIIASPPAKTNYNAWILMTVILFLLLIAGTFWHFRQMEKQQLSQQPESAEIARRDAVIEAMRLDFQQKQDSLTTLLGLPGSSRDSVYTLEIKRLREEIESKDSMLKKMESQGRAGEPQIALQFASSPNEATRGAGTGTDPTLDAEEKAFKEKKFDESIRLLRSISRSDPRHEEVEQRLPYSLFYATDFVGAIPAFLDLLEADQYEEINVQWHLLLCYVAIGDKSQTRYLLHAILKNPKHKYYKEAADLKKVLNTQ